MWTVFKWNLLVYYSAYTLVVESILNDGGVNEYYKDRIGIVLSNHLI